MKILRNLYFFSNAILAKDCNIEMHCLVLKLIYKKYGNKFKRSNF